MVKPDAPKLAGAALVSATLLWSGSPVLGQPAPYCEAQAREFADSYNSAGGETGALAGPALGGVGNGKRKSVGRGALIGAPAETPGVADTAGRWQQDYNYAYQRCMAATDRRKAPPAGTSAWLDYCSAKYRSFDRASGLYRSYAGNYKPCR